MPPPEAPLTTGLDRELPRVPRATATALPTRSPTATAGMPHLATTPPLRLLVASARETRLPLLTVDTNTDVPVATTPLPPERWELPLLVASEMDATVEFQATVARRPTVPMTDNTETRPPAAPPWPVVLSAAVARELPALPSTPCVTLTTLASEDKDSAVHSPTVERTSDVPVDSAKVAMTTVMLTPVAELLPLDAMPSAALAWLATLVASDALAAVAPADSLKVDTTPDSVELLATRVRPMAATRATAVPVATVVLKATKVVPDVLVTSLAVLATVPVTVADMAVALADSASPVVALVESASPVVALVASASPVVADSDALVASADMAAVPDMAVASVATET